MSSALIALVLLQSSAVVARAQSLPTATAVRVADGALRLDGRLDEAVWSQAVAATDFVQREPQEGAPARERTEVRFAYDGDALWIGARMHSVDPAAIRALVTRRDREGSSEQLIVSLDTYRDRRTAYSFGVTPAGVRIDYFHGSDQEGNRDYGWDPVWQAETAVDAEGWTAELRIPFTQLRFDHSGDPVWGVNLTRRVPARNEDSYWILVGREETGWSSRMGALAGLDGVQPTRRIEALPYLAAATAMAEQQDPGNPFYDERASTWRVGGDVKVGLGTSLTLDATFNPDFGQVEADPAEVNLSAYETFFPERRPFFLENSQLFGGRGLFYSRRIGAPPPITPDAEHHETRDNTTILGATKLTGRTPSGLAIGTLAAVTAEETVATYDDGEFGRAVVAPRTGYAVASVQQQFGRDASTLGALVTAVQRDLPSGSALAVTLPEQAFSGIIDGRLRWAGGKYDISAYVGATHVRGSADAIHRLQRSSRRYWQRPDARHVAIDATRTSMTGTMMGINHSKMAGAHWLWDIDLFQESPGLEPNDIGALGDTDDRAITSNLRFRETQPGRWVRAWVAGVEHASFWTFGREWQYSAVAPFANFTLPNFWRVNVDAQYVFGGQSDALTRGGPLMRMLDERSFALELQNSPGARTRWGIEAGFSEDEAGSRSGRVETSLSFRPGAQWELSLDPRWTRFEESRQYVTARDGGAATYGRRYIFAHVDRSEVAARLRLNYTLTPSVTLETYLEPFASSGEYHDFGELAAARSGSLRTYGTDGTSITTDADGTRTVSADGEVFQIANRDFNIRSMRSNVVLRWEWRPGSTAYLVWQQNGFAERTNGTVRPGDVFDAFGAHADHFVAVKLSYWLPLR